MIIPGMVGASHIALECRSISELYTFFTRVLGLKPKFGFTFQGRRIAILGARGIEIELIEDPEAAEHLASFHIAFKVRNIDTAIAAVRQQGIKIVREVYAPTKGIREALIEGPLGLPVQFVEEHTATLIFRTIKGDFRDFQDFPEDSTAEPGDADKPRA